MKICDRCKRRLKQGETCTCRHRLYDKGERDKARANFYHSTEWSKVGKLVKERANGLDEYALRYGDELLKGNLTHHIYEIEERPDLKLALDNLVYVSSATHNMIHREYDKGIEERRAMQKKLMAIRQTASE